MRDAEDFDAFVRARWSATARLDKNCATATPVK
jgi:hypothetical protein